MLTWLPLTYTLIALLYASFKDIRYREIPPSYWLIIVAIGLPITIAINSGDLKTLIAYQILSFIVIIPSYILYKTCMLGGADVLAFLIIALLTPLAPGNIIPLLYLTILYSTLPAIAYHLHSARLACSGLKLRCMFRFKFKIKARWVIEDPRFKWWLVDIKGGCSIEEDPRTLALKVSQGDLEAYIIASPGHPYIAHLTIGYLIAIVIGDKPLLYLILTLI